MTPIRQYASQRVAVLGLGRSGLATARALEAGQADVTCWDDNPQARATAEGQGFKIDPLETDEAWADIAYIVVSPGIPHLYPEPHTLVQKAWQHGVPVDNDVGLFFRDWILAERDEFEVQPRVVCVTGTNGKSTTTALIGHLLQHAGKQVQMGGNIGRAVLDLEPVSAGEIVVLELSSYQIELARTLAPDVAVFLNLSPDHLDRHGGLGGYFAAKCRLFTGGGAERLVISVDDMEGEYLAARLQAESELSNTDSLIRISARQSINDDSWSVSVKKGFLAERRKGRQVASVDLRGIQNLRGEHNWQNACAAFAACRSLGVAPSELSRGLASFPGLEHRCQLVSEHDGILYVNDSKATNADAAVRALRAYPSIRWIAGGRAKDGGIASIAGQLANVRKAYLVGESAEMFREQLGDRDLVVSGTIEEAVKSAASEARPGDVVLLSPAAASFDQFGDFAERGEAFVEAVRKEIEARSANSSSDPD